ncbi:MAG: JAB domain-containing protein [Giesbergeria sp.]
MPAKTAKTAKPKYPTIPLYKCVLVRDKSVRYTEKIEGSWQASEIAKRLTDKSPDESLILFLLDNRANVISAQVVATGSPDCVGITPAQLFRAAIIHNARAIIVAHNHPSGDNTLSADDRNTYRAMVRAAEVLGIRILDFIVVSHAQSGYSSIHVD